MKTILAVVVIALTTACATHPPAGDDPNFPAGGIPSVSGEAKEPTPVPRSTYLLPKIGDETGDGVNETVVAPATAPVYTTSQFMSMQATDIEGYPTAIDWYIWPPGQADWEYFGRGTEKVLELVPQGNWRIKMKARYAHEAPDGSLYVYAKNMEVVACLSFDSFESGDFSGWTQVVQ